MKEIIIFVQLLSVFVYAKKMDLIQTARSLASLEGRVSIESTRALMSNRVYMADIQCIEAIPNGSPSANPRVSYTFRVNNYPCSDNGAKVVGRNLVSTPSMTTLRESDFSGVKSHCKWAAEVVPVDRETVCYGEVVEINSLNAYLKQQEVQFLDRLAKKLAQDARENYVQIIREPQFQEFIKNEVRKAVKIESDGQ